MRNANNSITKLCGLAVLILFLALTPFLAYAQEMKEAADLYNAAAKSYKENPTEALKSAEKAIQICTKINDEEANKLKGQALILVPLAHIELGKKLFKAGDLDGSVEHLRKAQKGAEENKDTKSYNLATRFLANVLFSKSTKELKAGSFQNAIDLANESFSYNKTVEALLVIGQAQDSLKQYDAMLNTYEQGITLAKTTNGKNNLKYLTDLRILSTNYLKKESQQCQDKKQYDDAIRFLNRATKIDERDAELYAALAVCFMAKNNNDSVIINTNIAIENAPLTMDKAQLYFLKAQALQAKGEKDAACEAYKEAAVGQFKEAAEHQRKDVLKCK